MTETIPSETAAAIREALERAETLLRAMDGAAQAEQSKEDGWSRKERLGHLCDLAANFHQYLVRGSLDDLLAFPEFDSGAWVRMQRYSEADWDALVERWLAANRELLRLIAIVPEEKWAIPCLIGRRKPCSLAEVGGYYVKQLNRHLKTVLGEA